MEALAKIVNAVASTCQVAKVADSSPIRDGFLNFPSLKPILTASTQVATTISDVVFSPFFILLFLSH